MKTEARQHSVARRLMTVPGIGPVVDPARFRKAADVGAFLGLTPKRRQSGAVDWSGRISQCGDRAVRRLLFEAAASLIHRVQRFSPLKSSAVRLAGRRGFRKAAVATGRKLAVLTLTLWKREADHAGTKGANT